MQVKRYEAVSMGEAVKMVKTDLGPDAVILTSRKKHKGSKMFGIFGRPVIEVTAALPNKKREPVARRYNPNLDGRGSRRPEADWNSAQDDKGVALALEPVIDGLSEVRDSLDELWSGKKDPDAAVERISDDMREMKSMMSYIIDQSGIEKELNRGRSYLTLKRILKDLGIAEEYIHALLDDIIEKPGGGPEPDLKTMLKATATRIRDTITFGGAIGKPYPGDVKPKVVALVGPTGVGKTTTLAKIASSLSMHGAKVGFITIDTFRIAAVEQLKIYAGILNIPLEVVLSPEDMAHAFRAFRNKDVILIDTAGHSQRDLAQLRRLKSFLSKYTQIDTRLVLSASSSEKQMEETIRNFSELSISNLIFTKLDEATSLGSIFNQHIRTGIPVSYFTTGQRVPEDIEDATAKLFVKRFFSKEKSIETKAYV